MSQEVTEETRETLHVLELDRTPRPQKMAAERAYFDGAHEVRFTQRTFRPKHGADIDEIRAFVDSLDVRRREAHGAPPPLPQAPAPVAVPPKIPDHHREPLEAAIRGSLLSVDTAHRVGSGTVVDVAWESRDEGRRRALFIIEGGVARPFEDVEATVDSLPAPKVDAPSAPEPTPSMERPAPSEEKAEERKEKKGLLGRFGKEKAADAPPKDEPAGEEPKKRRFGFGRGK